MAVRKSDWVKAWSPYGISRKTNGPNLKNDKKYNFGHHFYPFDPNLGHQILFACFTSTSN